MMGPHRSIAPSARAASRLKRAASPSRPALRRQRALGLRLERRLREGADRAVDDPATPGEQDRRDRADLEPRQPRCQAKVFRFMATVRLDLPGGG